MSLIGTFPSIIVPGDPVASGPVMGNFNFIAGSINGGSCVTALKSSGVQTFTTSPSKVAFNTKSVDLKSEFDTTLFRFTALEAGQFWVSCEMILVNSGSQVVSLLVYKNGVAPTGTEIYSVTPLITVIAQSVKVAGLTQLAINDYIEIFCYANTGSVTTDNSGGNRLNIIQQR